MNIRNVTLALIIGLVYEIVFKLAHVLTPSLFGIPAVAGTTRVLSTIVGIVLILFMVLFYREERADSKIAAVAKVLIGCIVLSFILRLPVTRGALDYRVVRIVGGVVGLVRAVLFFVLLILYRRGLPSGAKPIRHAAGFVMVMFGIGILKSLHALVDYLRFVASGLTVDYPPTFHALMLALFLITHASLIYFLYRYYQLKAPAA